MVDLDTHYVNLFGLWTLVDEWVKKVSVSYL